MRLTISSMSVISFAALLVLTGCMQSNEELQARQRALDSDVTVLQSCAFEAVSPVRIETVSGQETADICEKVAKILGRNPSVKLLRQLSQAVYALKYKREDDDLAGNAYQFMLIAQARGQLKSDKAMIATFDVVYKIVTGMEGRVTLEDINVYLRSVGTRAKTITDDALIYDAAVLSVMKQGRRG